MPGQRSVEPFCTSVLADLPGSLQTVSCQNSSSGVWPREWVCLEARGQGRREDPQCEEKSESVCRVGKSGRSGRVRGCGKVCYWLVQQKVG